MIAKVSAICFAGAPGEDRTRGLLIRSETLYPLSYERTFLLSLFLVTPEGIIHYFWRHLNLERPAATIVRDARKR